MPTSAKLAHTEFSEHEVKARRELVLKYFSNVMKSIGMNGKLNDPECWLDTQIERRSARNVAREPDEHLH